MSTDSKLLWTALVAASLGCESADLEPGDGEYDRFSVGGKADAGPVVDGTPEARAVLGLANEGDLDLLLWDVGLAEFDTGTQAARNLIAVRLGDDAEPGTSDDERFETLSQLDAVPFVGPRVFDRMLAYVIEHDEVVEGTSVPQLPRGTLSLTGSLVAQGIEREHSVLGWSTSQRVPQTVDIRVQGSNPGTPTLEVEFRDRWRIVRASASGVEIGEDGSAVVESTDVQTDQVWCHGGTWGCQRWRTETTTLHAVAQFEADGSVTLRDFEVLISVRERQTGDPPDSGIWSGTRYSFVEELSISLSPSS